MADIELDDSADTLQARETEHAVPFGVWALFGGLVAWGIWYFIAYVGWDQAAEVTQGAKTALGMNIGNTIAFTAIPTAVVIALAVAMARRRRAGK